MTQDKVLVFDLSTEGLEPAKHRIVGITTKSNEETKVFTHRDEKKLLEEFWDYLEEEKVEIITGFNSDQFDIPFLMMRSVKYGIKVNLDLLVNSMDLRKVVLNGKDMKGKLTDFRDMLGIEFEDSGYAKSHMSLLWEAPHLEDLKEFLLEDVKITWALYEHTKNAGLV